MNNQQVRPAPYQQRLMVGWGIVALFLVVAIVTGVVAHGGGFVMMLRNILVSIAILAGLLCLLVYLARRMDWWLPTALRLSSDERDEDWRLLGLSLALIALPVIMLLTQHFLLHQ
ncbi:MAG TPA: hypothetical protein VFQ30_05380 [Ktedonobacteraceae bacterium]|nr:hypothetical protein [Ktedonobacteraceae bacterium]